MHEAPPPFGKLVIVRRIPASGQQRQRTDAHTAHATEARKGFQTGQIGATIGASNWQTAELETDGSRIQPHVERRHYLLSPSGARSGPGVSPQRGFASRRTGL